jgi:alcohol dehydrogenase class IV
MHTGIQHDWDVIFVFEIMQNRRVVYGPGSAAETGGILKGLAAKRLFILTYHAQAAPLPDILDAASQEGVEVFVCDIVQDEPDLTVIDQLVVLLKKQNSDALLALGGGSVLDAAKAAAMMATNGGTAVEYQMQGKAITQPSLPLIMIPTTAGTGSEANKTAVLRNNELNLKKSIYSPHMIAENVILDPLVTAALPAPVTAFTGIDALSHAIESYVSLNANPYTQMCGLQAVKLIGKSLSAAVADGNDMDARADMLYASYFAGCALNAGIGLAHIIAQPVGGALHIPHGEACSVFLPYAMEFNLETSADAYCEIGRALGLDLKENTVENAQRTIDKVRALIAEVNTPTGIKSYAEKSGLMADEAAIDKMVDFVQQATGHIKCNPRPVDAAVIKDVLKRAML